MTTRDFKAGFFGRIPFDKEARKQMKEEWTKMTDSEKLEFANKRMETFDNFEDRFSVEAIDNSCEQWLKMTPEEKQAFVDERKKAFESRMNNCGGFYGHRWS